MTQQSTEVTRAQLLEQAREAELLEEALIGQLNSLPFRIAEAKREADSRFNVATYELRSGRSNHVPTLDYSEATAIAEAEADLKERAKLAGLDKLRLNALAHRMEQQEHNAVDEALAEPEAELEREYSRIGEELKEVRAARATAARRRGEAMSLAMQYERAASLAAQDDRVFRRMT